MRFFIESECIEKEIQPVDGSNREKQGKSESVDINEFYEHVALNCFRYLGYKSFDEVDRLNLKEFKLLMKAHDLRFVDRMFELHLSAFKNYEVRARKRNGRPVYQNFTRFYNYKNEINRVLHGKKAEENDRFADLRKFVSQKAKMKKEDK